MQGSTAKPGPPAPSTIAGGRAELDTTGRAKYKRAADGVVL